MIHLVAEILSPEGRAKQWLSPSDTMKQLAFADARDLLKMALPEIERQGAAAAHRDEFKELQLHEYDHIGDSLLANEMAARSESRSS